jgi:hypothetical protein
MKKRNIKHNNLLPWFTDDHGTLPASYLASCRKFFDSICWPKYYGGTNTKGKIYKLQAASHKQQAASLTKRNKGL